MEKAIQLSTQIYTNLDILKDLVLSEIVQITEDDVILSVFLAASNIDEELKSSEISEYLYQFLLQLYDVQSNETADFEGKSIPGCVGISKRIEEDTQGKNCLPKNYEFYQVSGRCLNPQIPGAGLANRAMTRMGKQYCSLNAQKGNKKLPNERKLSLGIGHVLKDRSNIQNGLTGNLLALTIAQFVTHDLMQHIYYGHVSGSESPTSCDAMNNKFRLPKIFEAPFNDEASLDVDANDPFYKDFGVRCFDVGKNRVLNENCKIQKSNTVSN